MKRNLHARGLNQTKILFCVFTAFMLSWVQPLSLHALQFYEKGDFIATLDTTVSYSLQYRVEDPDKDLIGQPNGGNNLNSNWDDGTLNYDKGITSSMFKVISELEAKSRNIGLFVRGTAFYDYESENGDRERYDLSDEALDVVGSDVDLLDAYVWAGMDTGLAPFQIRVGEQVVNWGESTFIPGSIGLNTFNPIDVSKLRVPGAELRDALVPEGMVYGSVELLSDFTLEGLYVYGWEDTELDPVGSYWSGFEFAGAGVNKFVLPGAPDMGDTPADQTFLSIGRTDSLEPDDQGQFGVALRYYATWLNNTEFSLYYMNYHTKTPTLAVRSGTAQGAADGQAAAGQVYQNAGVAPGDDPAVDALAQAVAIDAYTKTVRYRTEFAEDISTLALGWNTELLGFGFQGEISHRQDVPLQIDEAAILAALVGTIDQGVADASQLGGFFNQDFYGQFETWLPDTLERDVTQVQITMSKLLGPILGSTSSTVLGEVGWHHIHDMPDNSELRLMSFYPHGTGNELLAPALTPGFPAVDSSSYPDENSWGYVILAMLEYNNLIGPVSVSPRIAWSHDVDGTSPNAAPFVQDRKAVTFGLGFRYLDAWTADLSYTSYFGAGVENILNDRDFIGFNLKYRF